MWAQRLRRAASHLPWAPGPPAPEQGLQQAIQLADWGWDLILQHLKAQEPDKSPMAIDDQAYRELETWKRVRNRLTFKPGLHDAN